MLDMTGQFSQTGCGPPTASGLRSSGRSRLLCHEIGAFLQECAISSSLNAKPTNHFGSMRT
jgi:hypothetical protein